MAQIRGLKDEDAKAFARMQQVIRTKRNVNQLRIEYADSEKQLEEIGFSIPDYMKQSFQTPLGWAEKVYKVPARRIRPDGFSLTRPSTMLDQIEDVFYDHYTAQMERMAIEASLELGPAFVFVTPGDTSKGEPKALITARNALDATCETDNRTGRTLRALEELSRNEYLLYLPGKTYKVAITEKGADYEVTDTYNGIGDRVMVTPYVWGKSLRRPYGKSRISKPIMGFVNAGVRTLLRQEVSAEFYSSPQRALLGADKRHFTGQDGKPISPLQALIGGIWGLPDIRDEETGDLVRPKLEQLSQATFQPHGEMMRGLAMQVSGESSIPVAYLGVLHDNPSSAEAIRANESDMINMLMDELDGYGVARVQVARDVAAVINGSWTPALETELRGLQSNFRDPGTVTKSEQSDAGLKYVQAFPDGDPEVAQEIYGLDRMQIQRNMRYRQEQLANQRLNQLLGAVRPPAPGQQGQQTGQPAPANAGAAQ